LQRLTGFAAFARQNIALVNPHFHANHTEGRVCFRQTVINIGTQCMQRDFALYLFLGASDFRSTQTSTADDSDTLRVCTHRLLHRLLHGAAERDTLLQLFGNTACNQVRIQFGLANLYNVQAHTLAGFCLKRRTQPVNFFTTFPDHNTGFGGMNGHRNLVCGGTLDLNSRDRGIEQFFVDCLTNQQIFSKDIFVITLSVPAGLPALNDAEPEPNGMHFMSQKCPPSSRP
jgi:hypothetical protein